jgi:hypothetical protein
MNLSMNSRPRVPADASGHELVQANAHLAYSCRVNSKSHNPSGNRCTQQLSGDTAQRRAVRLTGHSRVGRYRSSEPLGQCVAQRAGFVLGECELAAAINVGVQLDFAVVLGHRG